MALSKDSSRVKVILLSHSVMSNSLQPHGLWSARLLQPWDPPGKNTGAGCHFLLQGSYQPRDGTHVSCISCTGRQILYHWATWEVTLPWPQFNPVSLSLSVPLSSTLIIVRLPSHGSTARASTLVTTFWSDPLSRVSVEVLLYFIVSNWLRSLSLIQ